MTGLISFSHAGSYGKPMMIYLRSWRLRRDPEVLLRLGLGRRSGSSTFGGTPIGSGNSARDVVEVSDRLGPYGLRAHDGVEEIGKGGSTCTIEMPDLKEIKQKLRKKADS